MENQLTIACFEKEMERLISIYNYKTTKKQMELYYKSLKEKFSDKKFMLTVDSLITKEIFFPTIATFLKNKTKDAFWKAF